MGGWFPPDGGKGFFVERGSPWGREELASGGGRWEVGGGRWAVGGASALPLTNGRDDPARSSVVLSEWGIESEEEDLASGGRSELGRRAAPLPYP